MRWSAASDEQKVVTPVVRPRDSYPSHSRCTAVAPRAKHLTTVSLTPRNIHEIWQKFSVFGRKYQFAFTVFSKIIINTSPAGAVAKYYDKPVSVCVFVCVYVSIRLSVCLSARISP